MHTRCQSFQVRSAPACEAAYQFVKRHLASQARFMRDAAHWDEAKKQRIIEVSRSPSDTIVTTSGLLPQQRRRYHVARDKGQWSISAIDIECAVCCGQRQTHVRNDLRPLQRCGLDCKLHAAYLNPAPVRRWQLVCWNRKLELWHGRRHSY